MPPPGVNRWDFFPDDVIFFNVNVVEKQMHFTIELKSYRLALNPVAASCLFKLNEASAPESAICTL